MAKKHHKGAQHDGPSKDTINRQQMAAHYGFALAFMNSDPELKHLFNQAVKNTWTADMFVARLRNTKWFKGHSADVRNAILQKTSDPETYKQNVSKMVTTVVDTWGKAFGAGTGNYKQMQQWAEMAFRMGWSQDQLIDHMGNSINYQKLLANKQLGGTAAESEQQLDQLGSTYGVSLGTPWKAAQVKRLVEGGGTIGGIQDQVREMAKQQYGAFADQLDAGKTMSEIADPYVQKMSDLLELNPNSVGVRDGLIQKALTMKDAKGKPAAMNINDFANQVRGDKRWQYTSNAKQQVGDVVGSLLQNFGLSA